VPVSDSGQVPAGRVEIGDYPPRTNPRPPQRLTGPIAQPTTVAETGRVDQNEAVRWLPDPSIKAIRAALAVVAPELVDETILTGPRIPGNPPAYWRGTARVGQRLLAKFAWSPEAAIAVNRELDILILLRELAPSIPLPEIVFASRDPLLFVSRYVPGVPGGSPYAKDSTPSAIPGLLAAVLATLHDPALIEHLQARGVALDQTRPQATTNALRERLVGPIIDGPQAPRVLTWCDWIDDLQRRPAPETTTVTAIFTATTS
jgi:hypothetical protein